MPCLDRAEPVHLARLEEQRLDERRLARAAMADDGDVADLPGLECRHARLLLARIRSSDYPARRGEPSQRSQREPDAWRRRGYGASARCEAARKLRLQAQDRLRVELRDARLGHAEHLADLAQRQLLVVVERDDELLALGQARDRLAERLAHLGLRRARAAGRGRCVSSIVSISATWSPPPDARPQLVERRDRRAGDLGQARPRARRSVIPSFVGDLLVGRRALQLRSSSAIARSISRARARTERGTQSSERSSSMIAPLMRAIAYVSNLMSRSGSKRSIAPIRPSSPYETRSPSSTCAGRPAAEPAGDELDERRVREDQAVADRPVLGPAVLPPERLRVLPLATTREYAVGTWNPQRRRRSARRASWPIQMPSAIAASATTHARPPAAAAAAAIPISPPAIRRKSSAERVALRQHAARVHRGGDYTCAVPLGA